MCLEAEERTGNFPRRFHYSPSPIGLSNLIKDYSVSKVIFPVIEREFSPRRTIQLTCRSGEKRGMGMRLDSIASRCGKIKIRRGKLNDSDRGASFREFKNDLKMKLGQWLSFS